MSIDDFIQTDQYNLDHVRSLLPHFQELMPGIDALYERSRGLMPVAADQTTLIFARCHLLCHKGFLAAAVTIEAGTQMTRRPLHAGRSRLHASRSP